MNPLCLADLPAAELQWLWPGRIPIGKVTLLVGDPGVGKSLLALDVAARVTTGTPWPDESNYESQIPDGESNSPHQKSEILNQKSPTPPPNPQSKIKNQKSKIPPPLPASVLLLSAEDDLADTIRPRLEAAGADCSRIVAVPPGWSPEDPKGHFYAETGIPDFRPLADRPPPPRPFDLRHDVRLLDTLLMRRPDCRLVIVDPISAYLGCNVDNLNSEVRRLIAPLAALAARRRLAVVAVSHLRKQRGPALHRTMGSLAFVAAARATWLVAVDPQDATRRLMLPVKNNLGALDGGLSFTIAPSAPGQPPVVAWSPEASPLSADDAFCSTKAPVDRPTFERDDAARWLRLALAEGAKPSADVQREAVAHGLQLTTVRRAFRYLGGEAVRVGFGPLGEWFWRLPGVGVQEPKLTPTLSDDHLWTK